ncbi:alpha/beta hydrolase [Vibrio sp. JPW-9-11-11]|uniref:alpha/beta fold hydrolase n=1 Tax=Vibrio sp. JPW-9-11-11 TaxID=1416532 RepID=UPI0015945265|nr:alpha/beta hydrolase [Vibrio sp. JPW-9-11-11]NVD06805.1 alpha/beta hydrolase [Vibrio sp. JPW-9-11-11]
MHALPNFPQPKKIAINGVILEVFESGTENIGKPIILCHGWPEHAYCWRYQIPALVAEGYHVIVPNQRGFGHSSCPDTIEEYDVEHLCSDLIGLLDYYGYAHATFVGHDWGAMLVWWLALIHPQRVSHIVNLNLPYQERGDIPWIEWMEQFFGSNYYFVHFNRQLGVADAILEQNTYRFLHNLFRKNLPVATPSDGMEMIDLALAEQALGEPLMTKQELMVFSRAFECSGFTASINWYRNLDRNWQLLADVDPIVRQPALMIYGEQDVIPQSPSLTHFVPNVDVISLKGGHWLQQECPGQTNQALITWLRKQV